MDENNPTDYLAGHPIILYRKLDATWLLAEELESQTNDVKTSFLIELTRLLGVFFAAGVVHMDIRLSNIFFKVQDCSTVSIVVIDWDDALMRDAIIPEYLHSSDRSIPIPRKYEDATAEVNEYFVEKLQENIFSDDQHLKKKPRVEEHHSDVTG